MRHFDFHSIYARQPFCHALGEVNGAVLPAGAAKGDLKMVAAIMFVFFDGLADKRLRCIKKGIHLVRKLGKEIGNWLVASGVTAQGFVPERIGHCPTIEHKAPAIAGRVGRQAFFERE